MKKYTSISVRSMNLTLVLLLLVLTFAFAGDAIPGIGVGAGKNPGGIMINSSTTDSKGVFRLPTLEAGSYQITVNALEVKNAIATANKLYKSKDGKPITVVIAITQSPNISLNGQKRYGEIVLSPTKDNVIIVDLGKTEGISGMITTQTDTTKK